MGWKGDRRRDTTAMKRPSHYLKFVCFLCVLLEVTLLCVVGPQYLTLLLFLALLSSLGILTAKSELFLWIHPRRGRRNSIY